MDVKHPKASHVCVLLAGLLAGCGGAPVPASDGQNPYRNVDVSDAPNILLILADDMGYSDVGAFGSEIATPNIDSLARSGVMLTNFHVSASCAPTRAMLLTGVDNHLAGQGTMVFVSDEQRGMPGYEDHLNHRVVTLASLLKDAGYRTYMVGKWHLGSDTGLRPHERGFERSFALPGSSAPHFNERGFPPGVYTLDGEEVEIPDDFYSTDYYTDTLIEFIDQRRDAARPFFAYAAYTAPHWPLQAPDEFIDKYVDTYAAGWDQVRAERFQRMQAMGVVPATAGLPARLDSVPAWDALSEEDQRVEARKMAIHAAMVDNMDVNVGRLLAHLRDSGDLANTIVIFMSDNGPDAFDPWIRQGLIFRLMTMGADNSYENLGRRGSWVGFGEPWAQVSATPLMYYKMLASEGGIRAPLIVSYPARFQRGRIKSGFASVTDLVPTLLEMAGLEHPGNSYRGREILPSSGRSLVPVLTGERESSYGTEDFVGFELFNYRAGFAGNWKILRLRPPYGSGEWGLFDLSSDPGEQQDLAAVEPARLEQMILQYEDYVRRNGVVHHPDDFEVLDGSLSEFFDIFMGLL